MRTKIRAHWARIRVAFTLLVATAILSTLVYLLTGGGLFRAKVTIRSYFEDSGGMEPGAIITFSGVKIGKVDSVRLSHLSDPQRAVEVRMSIERRFLSQIPKDSLSEISTENVLGDKYIQINRGKDPNPVVENAELGHKPATNVYVRIDITTFTAQLRTVDAALKDVQEGKGPIGQFVMTDQLYRDLVSGVTKVARQIEAAADTQSPLGQLLYGRDIQDLGDSLQRVDAALAEIQAGRGSTGKLMRDPAGYDDIRKSLADMRRTVDQTRETEFIKSDASYRAWTEGLVSLSRAVDDFNRGEMLNNSQLYESLLGATLDLGPTLREFRLNPKKFLRLKIF